MSCVLFVATVALVTRGPLLHRLSLLDRAAETAPIVEAALGVCHALGDGAVSHTCSLDVLSRRQCSRGLLDHDLFDDSLQDVLLDALAQVAGGARASGLSIDDAPSSRVLEVAAATTASARFALLSTSERAAALEALEAAATSRACSDARSAALSSEEAFDGAASASHDECIIAALYSVAAGLLAAVPRLARLGFPASELGVRCLVASARRAGSQRAAASLGHLWHAGDTGAAPLILLSDDAASTGSDQGSRTLVVAFSSLGWNGLVRPEWGSTLRAGSGAETKVAIGGGGIDVAHALDVSRSWFLTDPKSGEYDDGAWWDTSLAALCAPYGRVCLLGESMGGTAALRFARHATHSVIALAPQVDLRDFGCCTRSDFDDARKARLRLAIARAAAQTQARVVLHVGRDPDDLYQLRHLPVVVELFCSQNGGAGAEAPEDPLPRDGMSASHAVGSRRLRVVKHDIEGHAVGQGLKEHGSLSAVILADILPATTATAVASRAPRPQLPPPLPSMRVEVAGSGWAAAAAESLDVHGLVVLSSPPSAPPLVGLELCAACCAASEDRLEELLGRIARRGVDRSDEFRFLELTHREGLRFDMPLGCGVVAAGSVTHSSPDDADAPSGIRALEGRATAAVAREGRAEAAFDLEAGAEAAFAGLHQAADAIAREALAAVVRRAPAECRFSGISQPPMAGCVISLPSASAQVWHSDGAEPGLYNVFVPLVSLTMANGPTELRPATHRHEGTARGHVAPRMAPLVRAGELLLFDYRVRHRGLANDCKEPRPVAYLTYAVGEARDANFPDACTLAYD